MEVNSENLSSASPTAGQKKLKQTRLPFAILSPVSTSEKAPGHQGSATQDSKKRKLSEVDGEVPLPAAKIGKVQATKKENTVQVESEVIDLIDDSDDDAPKEGSSDPIKIKLPIGKKNNNKKLKLDQSGEKTKKRSHKKEHKHKSKAHKARDGEEKVESMEVVCLDDDNDDEPKPLETSIVEESSVTEIQETVVDTVVVEIQETVVETVTDEAQENSETVTKELPKPNIQEKPEAPESSQESDKSKSSKVLDLTVEESDLDVTGNEVVPSATPKTKTGTPGSGIKRSHKKLSEEEKLLRQQERDEQRRLEREAKETIKRQEREAKEAQRLKEKQEREAKLQQEREEKETQKRLEKEEREKKKQAELEQKAEEKRQKELKKDEASQKWKKSAQLMEKLFKVQKKSDTKQPEEESSNDSEKIVTLNFMPFQVKENMRLAPTTRAILDKLRRDTLDKTLNNGEPTPVLTYLSKLKRNSDYQPGKCASVTWQEEDDSQDIILIDTQGEEHQLEQVKKPKQKYRAKFLHFHENRRPAYYGTWQKKSTNVKGRTPFKVDTKVFDYEVDSDEEWEEEEPGESLHGSDDEKDKDNVDDDYEVDNEFFVPHGHLSDEELEPDGDIAPEDNSPEAQKARLKYMQQEFVAEHKKKTEKIKPRIIGCIWVRTRHGGQDQCSPIVWEMLSARAMISAEPITSILDDPEDEKVDQISTTTTKKVKITEDGIKELIGLVHGNPNSKKFLSDEFAAYRKQKYGEVEGYQEFMLITSKIKEIAEYKQSTEDGPMFKVNAWFVKPEILEKYQLTDLPIINTWKYVLTPKTVVTKDSAKKFAVNTPATVKKVPVTEEAMPDLIRLVHGNMRNRQFLIEEFRTFRKNTYGHLDDFQEFYHISNKIQQISEYKKCEEEGPMKGKTAYYVHDYVLKAYGLEDISLPNTWQYHAIEKKKEKPTKPKGTVEPTTEMPKSDATASQPGAGPLAKVTDKVSEVKSIPMPTKPKPSSAPPQKKRVQLLMSVPKGESIPEAMKNNLISKFLQKSKSSGDKTETSTTPSTTTTQKNDDDDVMIID